MFDKLGQPYGYGQDAPGKDQPQPASQQSPNSPQQQQTPLQTAVSGGPQALPQYQPDQGFMNWRQSTGQTQPIGTQQGGLSQAINPFMQAASQGSFNTPNSSLPNIGTSGPVGTQPMPRAMTPGANAAPSQGGLGAGGAFTPGGNLKDPAYVSSMIAHYAAQPGANPSLTRDPGYWQGKIMSGELGSDPNYIVGKFMTPEGAGAAGGSVSGSMNPLMMAIAGNQQNQMQQTNQANQSYLQNLLSKIPQ